MMHKFIQARKKDFCKQHIHTKIPLEKGFTRITRFLFNKDIETSIVIDDLSVQ